MYVSECFSGLSAFSLLKYFSRFELPATASTRLKVINTIDWNTPYNFDYYWLLYVAWHTTGWYGLFAYITNLHVIRYSSEFLL